MHSSPPRAESPHGNRRLRRDGAWSAQFFALVASLLLPEAQRYSQAAAAQRIGGPAHPKPQKKDFPPSGSHQKLSGFLPSVHQRWL